jgi:hypothetical protein
VGITAGGEQLQLSAGDRGGLSRGELWAPSVRTRAAAVSRTPRREELAYRRSPASPRVVATGGAGFPRRRGEQGQPRLPWA